MITSLWRTELGHTSSTIKAIYHAKSFIQSTENVPAGQTIGLILDRTNFYAESGGQEADTGRIGIDGEADFEVLDVQVFNGYVLHIGLLSEGQLSVNNEVVCTYDEVSHPIA